MLHIYTKQSVESEWLKGPKQLKKMFKFYILEIYMIF